MELDTEKVILLLFLASLSVLFNFSPWKQKQKCWSYKSEVAVPSYILEDFDSHSKQRMLLKTSASSPLLLALGFTHPHLSCHRLLPLGIVTLFSRISLKEKPNLMENWGQKPGELLASLTVASSLSFKLHTSLRN